MRNLTGIIIIFTESSEHTLNVMIIEGSNSHTTFISNWWVWCPVSKLR
jgi:hypothetical protein